MKVQFDPQEIESLAQKVAEYLKPLLNQDGGKNLEDELLTVEEAAAFLKTSKGQIYQWVNDAQHELGDFPYLKAGRLLRFSKKAIMRWLLSKSNSSERR